MKNMTIDNFSESITANFLTFSSKVSKFPQLVNKPTQIDLITNIDQILMQTTRSTDILSQLSTNSAMTQPFLNLKSNQIKKKRVKTPFETELIVNTHSTKAVPFNSTKNTNKHKIKFSSVFLTGVSTNNIHYINKNESDVNFNTTESLWHARREKKFNSVAVSTSTNFTTFYSQSNPKVSLKRKLTLQIDKHADQPHSHRFIQKLPTPKQKFNKEEFFELCERIINCDLSKNISQTPKSIISKLNLDNQRKKSETIEDENNFGARKEVTPVAQNSNIGVKLIKKTSVDLIGFGDHILKISDSDFRQKGNYLLDNYSKCQKAAGIETLVSSKYTPMNNVRILKKLTKIKKLSETSLRTFKMVI